MATVIDFTPRQLKTDNNSFVLSKEAWLTIQVYVQTALALPTDAASMRDRLKMKSDESIEPFQKIINAYTDIYKHCKEWDDTTFTETVNLAGDIVNYNRLVKGYLKPVVDAAEKLVLNPKDAEAKATVIEHVSRLQAAAKKYEARASTAAKHVQEFTQNTRQDQRVIQGPDGEGGLVKEYKDKYGATSAEGKALQQELDQARALLQDAIDERQKDIIIAATTPTYAMVPVYGWIIAPTIAGIYTDKALKALKVQEHARAEISRLEGKIARNILLVSEIDTARAGMTQIQKAMNDAIPTIDLIRGVWNSLAKDMSLIVENMEDNFDASLPRALIAAVPIALEQWQSLADRADKYRDNAYIKVEVKAA